MRTLAVFTRDLRLHDNPALVAAGPAAVPLFVSDPDAIGRHRSANRQAYLAECLRDLDTNLRLEGSSLVHRTGDWVDTVVAVAIEARATEIHLARDVSAYAQRRLSDLGKVSPVPIRIHDSVTVIRPGAVAPAASSHYQVFTPYFRRWALEEWRPLLPAPSKLIPHDVASDPLPEVIEHGTSPQRQRGGESSARYDMDRWIPRARRYKDTRNSVALDGTSRLSAALHFGTLSPLEVAVRTGEAGADAYVRQIAWRDFNAQVLMHRPSASWEDYRAAEPLWNTDRDALDAWTRGETGFPLVDAGMRQLVATGWMHNRTRMVVASFLTKDLMIDWRIGARHFMDWLTDGDVANNQLGWQWVAGTGTDANPTRIFNPTLQSQRFDPEGDYIRMWVSELQGVDAPEIHDPGPLTRAAVGYPLPIVDHHEAIRSYKEARGYG